MSDQDAKFFIEHADRQARIRLPAKTPHINKQRAVRYLDECEMEFRHLGSHDPKRRRILVYRVPCDNPLYNPEAPQLLKIPFLAFADETIEDRDDVLLPLIDQIMQDASS